LDINIIGNVLYVYYGHQQILHLILIENFTDFNI